jgi:hypothetical protein
MSNPSRFAFICPEYLLDIPTLRKFHIMCIFSITNVKCIRLPYKERPTTMEEKRTSICSFIMLSCWKTLKNS